MARKTWNEYFLAIVPPDSIGEQVTDWKHYFREHYHSQAALRSPPHITLHMPFRGRPAKDSELIHHLEEFASGQSCFDVSLDGFGCFAPRVVYIRVVPDPSLLTLQQELTRFCRTRLQLLNATYRDEPYHPHLTLAFRDLKKEAFAAAWGEFQGKDFTSAFRVDHLVLLLHDGSQWNVHRRLPLKSE